MGHFGKTLILFLGLGCGTLNFTRTYDLENDREWTYPQEAPGERDRRSIDLERSGRTRSGTSTGTSEKIQAGASKEMTSGTDEVSTTGAQEEAIENPENWSLTREDGSKVKFNYFKVTINK